MIISCFIKSFFNTIKKHTPFLVRSFFKSLIDILCKVSGGAFLAVFFGSLLASGVGTIMLAVKIIEGFCCGFEPIPWYLIASPFVVIIDSAIINMDIDEKKEEEE